MNVDSLQVAAKAAEVALPRSLVGAPKVGVVLGSGLGGYVDGLTDASSVAYRDLPSFPSTSVPGHVGKLWFGRSGKVPVAVLQGRVHLYEGFGPSEVVFPVRVLAGLGIEIVCLSNAAGGVRESFGAGELMRIADHLNLTAQNPLTGIPDAVGRSRFVDLSQAYDPQLGEVLEEVAQARSLRLHAGIYAQLPGPSYETPAEIRMLRALGVDAVGMSTVLETIALRHLGVRVVGVSCITNPAAGVSAEPVLHSKVTAEAARAGRDVGALLDGFIARVA